MGVRKRRRRGQMTRQDTGCKAGREGRGREKERGAERDAELPLCGDGNGMRTRSALCDGGGNDVNEARGSQM
ncbi:hypothetical protein CEP54_007100 [Fusarium duplospermum]|uniref:Uncharacterized protein n=1 Tax=Fusarium duplospermum TaxID=1325734 RepID=A0A428Q3C5_9HYPO|nr:hypothetical protein CEP54_007100 [Fusarium duplospermum]